MEKKNSNIETSDEFFEKVDEIFQEIDKKAKKPIRQEEIEGEKIKAEEQDEESDEFIKEKISAAESTIQKPVHVHIKEREHTEKINKLFSPRFILIAFSLIFVCTAIYLLFFKSEPISVAEEVPVVRPPAIESFVIVPQPAVKGETAQATITLRAPALEGGAVVKLVPRESEAMNIPAEIRIPEGVRTGNFEIQISREAPNSISIEAQASSISKMWASVSLNAPKEVKPPVPDVKNLPRVIGECSAEITSIPTATDYRSEIIKATTNDPLEYTEQGTYEVTWRYADDLGNKSYQKQTVIVQDITPPVPDVKNLQRVTGKGSAEITSTPSATDNCSGNVMGSTNNPRRYTKQGTYTVTWRYVDGYGNTSTQTQTVTVEPAQPPPQKINTGDIVPIKDVDVPPEVVERVAPKHPPDFRRIGGVVLINALISEDGDVIKAEIIKKLDGPPVFNESAKKAILQWKFKPAVKNGVRVKVWQVISVRFKRH